MFFSRNGLNEMKTKYKNLLIEVDTLKKKNRELTNELWLMSGLEETKTKYDSLLIKVEALERENRELIYQREPVTQETNRDKIYEIDLQERLASQMEDQIRISRIQVDRIKKEYREKINSIINEIREEKIRILTPILINQDVIYHRANNIDDDTNNLGELQIIAVENGYIKCKKEDKEYTFGIELMGRILSFTIDSMSRNNPAIPEILYLEREETIKHNFPMSYWQLKGVRDIYY